MIIIFYFLKKCKKLWSSVTPSSVAIHIVLNVQCKDQQSKRKWSRHFFYANWNNIFFATNAYISTRMFVVRTGAHLYATHLCLKKWLTSMNVNQLRHFGTRDGCDNGKQPSIDQNLFCHSDLVGTMRWMRKGVLVQCTREQHFTTNSAIFQKVPREQQKKQSTTSKYSLDTDR